MADGSRSRMGRVATRGIIAGCALACMAACADPEPEDDWRPATTPGPTRTEVFRGFLHEPRPGRLVFEPCRVNMWVDVQDRTGTDLTAARKELASAPGAKLAVEMRVQLGARMDDWRTETDRVFVALELLRAMSAGQGDWCATALPSGQTRALGVEPSWSVSIGPEGIEWNEPHLPAPLLFPAAKPSAIGGARTWTSVVATEPHRAIRIVVTPGRCRDAMSGAWFPAGAEVTLDDRVVHGCAFDGE